MIPGVTLMTLESERTSKIMHCFILGFPTAIIALSLAVFYDQYGMRDTYVNNLFFTILLIIFIISAAILTWLVLLIYNQDAQVNLYNGLCGRQAGRQARAMLYSTLAVN